MPALRPGEVHIWSAHGRTFVAKDIESTLSAAERTRADRFHFPQHRLAYMFAHFVLRDILSRYLLCSRASIVFYQNAFGKPFIDSKYAGETLEFNISHTGDLVVVALCGGCRVGVDVEEIRPLENMLAIAEAHFTSQEFNFVFGQHSPTQRERAFWSCWTRKEAYVKALGKGLWISPKSFDTLIASPESHVFLKGVPSSADQATWELMNLKVRSGFATALAVESGIDRLSCFEWPDASPP